jgi:5-methylcytosine-specific restriction endonuclease McrA
MKKPDNPKERNLLKGAMRRLFGRSELRNKVLNRHNIEYFDLNRPRVTKWSFCGNCGALEPRYKMEVDHIEPLIPVDKSLEQMSWDEVVDRLWCDEKNLMPICKDCHKIKTTNERKQRGKKK